MPTLIPNPTQALNTSKLLARSFLWMDILYGRQNWKRSLVSDSHGMQVSNMYFSQKYNQNPEPHKWSVQKIESLVQKASSLEEFSYGAETHYLYNMFDHFPVKGLHGVVLGTEMPWLEAILLSKGTSSASLRKSGACKSNVFRLNSATYYVKNIL